MFDDPPWSAALESGFFDGRLLIDILSWDWTLRVTVSPSMGRARSRFKGGFDFGRNFQIQGRICAPATLRDRRIAVTLSPFGPKVLFGRKGLREVGWLRAAPEATADFQVSLMLPESAIPTTATSLGTNWKYLHLWTLDENGQGARISAFTFSAAIHPNLLDWANAD